MLTDQHIAHGRNQSSHHSHFLLGKHNKSPKLFILRKVSFRDAVTVGLGGGRGEGLGFHLTHLLQADSTKTNTDDLISTNCIGFQDLTGKSPAYPLPCALSTLLAVKCTLLFIGRLQKSENKHDGLIWNESEGIELSHIFYTPFPPKMILFFILIQSKAPEWFPVYFSDCRYCSCPVIGWKLVALVGFEVYGWILTT